MNFLLIIGSILMVVCDVTNGYGLGAPVVQCVPMTPCHTTPQEGDPPTDVIFSSPCYTPSMPLNVEIKAHTSFKGIYLQIRKHNTSRIAEGSFQNVNMTKFKFVSCRPGRNNAFTNRHPREISQATFTWTPSANNNENLDIVYTFVESYYKIWVKAKKFLPKCE